MTGWSAASVAFLTFGYTAFHIVSLNMYPIETWTFRMIHVLGAMVIGFLLFSAHVFDKNAPPQGDGRRQRQWALFWGMIAGLPVVYAAWPVTAYILIPGSELGGDWERWGFGIPLSVGTALATVGAWMLPGRARGKVHPCDIVLVLAALVSSGYLICALDGAALRMRAGTPFAAEANTYAAIVGVVLICEFTRRLAGLSLVVISVCFIAYSFVGPWLPSFLRHNGFSVDRFFTYIYTDNGILGPTTAVSSTYIILFIIFAAFLQASRVGEFFINLAFAAAGRTRGGPAKVAIFASGLTGMINGTSAGNVVATGSLTIPLMKRVGYAPRMAGAIEAAASTGGQIMPPIMGAGAFIMAEVTGIPYSDIALAAVIPSVLYFLSILFMVDFAAARMKMTGLPADQLPRLSAMLRQAYLIFPIILLIATIFMGYSVIRAGTLAVIAAVMVSWLSSFRMGPKAIYGALSAAGVMSIQIIAVCACAGIVVGVIALTGVGARFSSILLGIASSTTIIDGKLLAMFFAMVIAIILGMGMPTTAAYAIAGSVVAPGLINMGIDPLAAHFFVFYFAVVSAITPPVALASYAAAAISGAGAMETSVTSFRIGLAAFIVPFMFFYTPALLLNGDVWDIAYASMTASVGIYFLAAGIQGWFFGRIHHVIRIGLVVAAVLMMKGGLVTDIVGASIAVVAFLMRGVAIGRSVALADEESNLQP
ncbi:TRAP transporter fused permease subunit [bacterium SCSIO 12827]|nr:TRAP transporter fused permease subunit [bacterium SCSIO 12827]